MREVTRDEKFPDVMGLMSSELEATGAGETGGNHPTEAQMVIITLLMRIYDLQYASLYIQDARIADEVFASHNKGELGNPKMFIPELVDGESRVAEEG